MKLIKDIRDSKKVIGMINKSSGSTLDTYKTPYCAVVVNHFHGFKKAYFVNECEAIIWIFSESNKRQIFYSTSCINIHQNISVVNVASLYELSLYTLNESILITENMYKNKNMKISAQIYLSILYDLLKKQLNGIISVNIINIDGEVIEINMV